MITNLIKRCYKDKSIQEQIKNIKDSEDFYFEKGKQALDALTNADIKLFNDLYEYTQKNKQWYSSLYGENVSVTGNKLQHIKTCEMINKFVAYCDINAKGKGVNGESYYEIKSDGKPDKRCIAKVNMTPSTWIMNILKYLLNLKDTHKNLIVNDKVQRAINYFDNPDGKFPIVSEEHRKQISKFFLSEEFVDCDEKLKTCFNEKINEDKNTKNKDNLTCIYTNIIYAMKDSWEDFDLSFYKENKNVILTGAPGTGKTYLAKKIAAKLIGCKTNELKNHHQFGFVQFHPSYDYTDFVEGLRPKQNSNNNGVDFELKNGIFKDFCEKAAKTWLSTKENLKKENKEISLEELEKQTEEKTPKFVFVIDEINRGEISKIFGELFFSIDPGYRGEDGAVLTQYSNMRNYQQECVQDVNIFDKILRGENHIENQSNGKTEPSNQKVTPNGHFFIPKNVYIIGTMNDIDRSVESMDFAFRRRFAFKEITAAESKENILYYSNLGLDLETLGLLSNAMDAINKKLSQLGFNDSYHIGGAYFQKISKYYTFKKTKMWDSLWQYHLKGTLYEYFRGEPDAEKKMADIKSVYEKVVCPSN